MARFELCFNTSTIRPASIVDKIRAAGKTAVVVAVDLPGGLGGGYGCAARPAGVAGAGAFSG